MECWKLIQNIAADRYCSIGRSSIGVKRNLVQWPFKLSTVGGAKVRLVYHQTCLSRMPYAQETSTTRHQSPNRHRAVRRWPSGLGCTSIPLFPSQLSHPYVGRKPRQERRTLCTIHSSYILQKNRLISFTVSNMSVLLRNLTSLLIHTLTAS